MVIKLFDLFHYASIDIVYILAYYFDKLHIVKPFTSRSANSEKYIVCKSFRGIEQEDLNSLYNIVDEMVIFYLNNTNMYEKLLIMRYQEIL